jgi:hypothetical protein
VNPWTPVEPPHTAEQNMDADERKRLERAFKAGLVRFKKFGIYGTATSEVEAAARVRFVTMCTGKTADTLFMARVERTAGNLTRLACITLTIEHRRLSMYRK